VADYVDGLLGAFLVDPPRIWAGGPFSGRHGGDAGFERFLALGAVEELAWRIRIEGSQGRPEREFNGPVTGLQQQYAEGLTRLGNDFPDVDADAQDARLSADPAFARLLYEHACEGMYGDPVYDPATSVVDPAARFHDIENLLCADSSVFVTSTGYNPTPTIVALAHRSASLLCGRTLPETTVSST